MIQGCADPSLGQASLESSRVANNMVGDLGVDKVLPPNSPEETLIAHGAAEVNVEHALLAASGVIETAENLRHCSSCKGWSPIFIQPARVKRAVVRLDTSAARAVDASLNAMFSFTFSNFQHFPFEKKQLFPQDQLRWRHLETWQ